MLRQANVQNTFSYREEEGQNPYIGFISYQHFRGEALYSDAVVRPENNMTETEAFECYPIPKNVPQNGREEGFYPDTTVAYIRFLWKEFEPEEGQFRYELMEEVLDKARSCGQTVMFRLIPHSTRSRDDVPEWLKKYISCPERPEGKRVKDSPKDPKYLEYFGRAIRALGERFDADSTLDVVDISLTGSWGEGHQLEEYPREALEQLMDVYMEAFPNTMLIGQCCAPWLIDYVSSKHPIGWRGDGVGEPQHMLKAYPERAAFLPDVWKQGPVSFESYWWLCEWKRRGWDLDQIIQTLLGWHVSTFNAKSLPIPEEWQEQIRSWNNQMGYHFAPKSFSYPEQAQAGDTLELKLTMINHGVAPIYHQIPVMLRLRSDAYEKSFPTGIDVMEWMPGEKQYRLELTLPEELPAGSYALELGIVGEATPMIYLCTDAERNGRFYRLGTVTTKEKENV